MRVIFLEVEGVLMPPVVKMVARLMQKPIVAFKPSIDALNLIIKETKAELVIHNVTGVNNIATQTKLKEWGLRPRYLIGPQYRKGKEMELLNGWQSRGSQNRLSFLIMIVGDMGICFVRT